MSISVYVYLFLAAVNLLVLFPLLLIKSMRRGVGAVLSVSSWIMMALVWLWGAFYTYTYFGTFWLVIGIFTGLGVLPLAAVGLFINSQIGFWLYLACYVVPLASFALGVWAADSDGGKNQRSAYVE